MLAQAVFALAVLPATLLAFNVSPSATLLNQLLAVGGWGVVVGTFPKIREPQLGSLTVLMAGLGLATVAIAISMAMALPNSLALTAMALVLVAAVLALAAHQSTDEPDAQRWAYAFHSAMFWAGLASAAIGLIQVFMPSLANGSWIAQSGLAGRAVGNLRQPNHLSSLLIWALVAWVPLAQQGRVAPKGGRVLAVLLALPLMWAVVLSASRTGIVGVVVLALWGALDRRLARWIRVALFAAPVAYGVFALGMSAWAHATAHTFGGEARLSEGDISASRFGIWSNTLDLIRQNAWTGTGFGEFNFAWTLTPFPGRPVAFFDHTHNLPLQLWVELGIPLGSLMLALLLWALVQAARRSWQITSDDSAVSRAAFMMVLMIGVHSLFEYPLWYAYFLLPTAWAWGYALRAGPRRPQAARTAKLPIRAQLEMHHALRAAGALMVAGCLFALHDYWKVVVIYAPADDAAPLPERIEQGQASFFFSHHADYAAATTSEPPSSAMGAFNTTTHSLLDTRLMQAWANALDESGHRDKASYLAARLREFRNPAATAFFTVCQDAAKMAETPPPFQCVDPPPGLSWRDFQTPPE